MRHAAPVPVSDMIVHGIRDKVMIKKEDNFTQPGDRYRSWDPARQERFRSRFLHMLLHPRVTRDIRRYDYLTGSINEVSGFGLAIGPSVMPISEQS